MGMLAPMRSTIIKSGPSIKTASIFHASALHIHDFEDTELKSDRRMHLGYMVVIHHI